MFSLLRRVVSRLASSADRDERPDRALHGPLVAMLECDLHNLDRLTRAAHAGLPSRGVE